MSVDVVITCDNTGRKLARLRVSIQRASKLSSIVEAPRGSFQIGANNPLATKLNLADGNIIYIENSEPTILPYAGVLWPSDPSGTEINNGILTKQLRSVEWLLHTCTTNTQDKFDGTPGEIFIKLLDAARIQNFFLASTDTSSISLKGTPQSKEYNLAPIYEAMNALATDNDAYWYLKPSVDSFNNLTFVPVFQYKRTSFFKWQLHTGGSNPNLAIKKIQEIGEPYNHVIAYGHFESWDDPLWAELYNSESVAYYNAIYTKAINCPNETTEVGLLDAAAAELKKCAFSRLAIDGVITRPPYPQKGDICNVFLTDSGGYITDRRGSIVAMQVESQVYTPQDGTMLMRLTEIY